MAGLNLQGGDNQATADNIRIGTDVIITFVKQGGIELTNGLIYQRRLSDVQTLGAWAAEFVNERKHFESGKKYLTTDDGTNLSNTVTFEGDSFMDVASLIGQAGKTDPSIDYGLNYGTMGHFMVYSTNKATNLRVIDVIFDVGVKLSEIPGSQDGEINHAVTLYTDLARSPVRIYRDPSESSGGVPSAEIYYDNGGTITNAFAPDGILTDFVLGKGNDSYAVAAAPSILPVDSTLTGLYKYFYIIRIDGIDVNDSEATFNSTTKTITFGTAPAALSKLEVVYLVDGTAAGVLGQPAHLHPGSSFLTDWKTEQLA